MDAEKHVYRVRLCYSYRWILHRSAAIQSIHFSVVSCCVCVDVATYLMQLFPSTPTVAIKVPENGIVFQDLDKLVPFCDVVVVVVIQNSQGNWLTNGTFFC